MDDLKMPERQPGDGTASVQAPTDGVIAISVTTDGEAQAITMSRYNAWRVFGMLALMLGLPLSAKVGKAIKL
jgi:hypothetical protein